MLNQILNLGQTGNDGNGDTLRSAGAKMNANFAQIFSTYAVTNTITNNAATNEDGIFIADTTSNPITIVLPTAVGNHGKMFMVKKIAAGNTVTIDANASETIDGAATKVLSAQWESVTIISNGANWFII
jgi:hypothetical protein|tara:strand:- start:680 stop:1066 length:387 start_codon:yes stop_codon:yes gene_type:complete